MAPRAYRQQRRAASKEETRRRIVEATMKLHKQRGFAATSWQDIADAADVAVGTVYYHFPTFDELIPACSGLAMELMPLPTNAIFRGVRSRKQRLRLLVEVLHEHYEAARTPLFYTLTERAKIPAVDRFARHFEDNIGSLVRDALGPGSTPEMIAEADALADFRVWDAMRERGLPREVIASVVVQSILGLPSVR
jgi:AcrR family transcriptional regulator